MSVRPTNQTVIDKRILIVPVVELFVSKSVPSRAQLLGTGELIHVDATEVSI